MQVLKIDDLNADDITFKHKNNDGKIQIKIVNSKTGYYPIITTSWVIIPFDVSSYAKNKGATEQTTDWTVTFKDGSCYRTMELTNPKMKYDYEQNKTDTEKLFAFFKAVQSKGIDFAHQNSKLFFKKEIKRDIIEEAYYTKFVKKNDKKDAEGNPYPDLITTKIMKNIQSGSPDFGKPDFRVEDLMGNRISIDSWEEVENKFCTLVPKGTPARFIIQLRGYLVNNKFGISVKLNAILIDDKKKNNLNNVFTFREPDAEPVAVVKKHTKAKSEVSDTATHDSEDEHVNVEYSEVYVDDEVFEEDDV